MKRTFFRGVLALAVGLVSALVVFSNLAVADTVTARVRAAISAVVEGSADFANPKFTLPFAGDIVMLSGTTDGKANLMWADQRTISASANEDLDLSGSLKTPVGSNAIFVDVTAILVRAASGNTNNVLISPAATNGFTGPFNAASDVVAVQPGGAALFVAPNAGWGVTASTGDLLNIANSAGSTTVTYDIIVVGRAS